MMRALPRRLRMLVAPLLVLAVFALWAGAVAPPAASATKPWTVTASPSTLTIGRTTAISVKVTAMGSTRIGSVVITIPAGFTVVSVAAPSPWVAQTVAVGPPATIRFNVPTGPQSLTKGASATFTVTVLATSRPAPAWTVATDDRFTTTTAPSNGPPTAPLPPFTILPAPTPTPLPTSSPTAPAGTPAPGASSTPSPAPGETPAPTPASSGASTPSPSPSGTGGAPFLALDLATQEGVPVSLPRSALGRSGGVVVVTGTPSHGTAKVRSDGSITYTPLAGFVGVDSFGVQHLEGDVVLVTARVTVHVSRANPSQPGQSGPTASPSGDVLVVRGGTPGGQDVVLGSLGPLEFAFDWLVPGFVVSVPGLLIVLVFVAQALGGGLWLPVVRREIGELGLRPRRKVS